jgi:hypothetical protein
MYKDEGNKKELKKMIKALSDGIIHLKEGEKYFKKISEVQQDHPFFVPQKHALQGRFSVNWGRDSQLRQTAWWAAAHHQF